MDPSVLSLLLFVLARQRRQGRDDKQLSLCSLLVVVVLFLIQTMICRNQQGQYYSYFTSKNDDYYYSSSLGSGELVFFVNAVLLFEDEIRHKNETIPTKSSRRSSSEPDHCKMFVSTFLDDANAKRLLFEITHPYLIQNVNKTNVLEQSSSRSNDKTFVACTNRNTTRTRMTNDDNYDKNLEDDVHDTTSQSKCPTASTTHVYQDDDEAQEQQEDNDNDVNEQQETFITRHKMLFQIINHLISKLSLNMAELGPSMWCLSYLIVSMCIPLIFMISTFYLILYQLTLILGHLQQRQRRRQQCGHCELNQRFDTNSNTCQTTSRRTNIQWMAILSLLCWSFLIQDTSYYQEFGFLKYAIVYIVVVCITTCSLWMLDNEETAEAVGVDRSNIRPVSHSKQFFYKTAFPILIVTSSVWFQWIKRTNQDLPILYDPSDSTSSSEAIRPGLYYDSTNKVVSDIINKYWPRKFWTYNKSPWWIVNGDMRTGLPFLLNSLKKYNHTHVIRRWLPLAEEKEAIALDFVFPSDNNIHVDKPIYIILHGINGSEQEGYVLDFTGRAISQGSTVVVMNTRGLNGSPIISGKNILHFARISDLAHTVKVLRTIFGPNIFLGGVGYSMGAITLANYVARSESNCEFNGAVAISGSLNPTLQPHYKHSARIWQPMIVKALRDNLLKTPWLWNKIKSKFAANDIKVIRKAKTMMEFDDAVFVQYHHDEFQSLEHYYKEMGAMSHITNVSIPLLSIHSMDDPIAYWKCSMLPKNNAMNHTNNSLIDQVVRRSNGYLVQLWTQKGGHVGWPTTTTSNSSSAMSWHQQLRNRFQLDGWKWMNDAAISFLIATQQASQSIDSDKGATE